MNSIFQEALMGKSLPSLSDFFNSKKANNASENILLGAGRTITSKSSEDTEENNIANGSNTNAQKLSVLPPISLQVTKKFRFSDFSCQKCANQWHKSNPDQTGAKNFKA